MEKIEIITSRDFSNSELDNIKQDFADLTPDIRIDNQRMIRESVETSLPPAIWIFIYFATGAVLTGFFAKAGSDAYDTLKKAVKKLANQNKNGKPIQVRLHLRPDNSRDIIVPIPDNPTDFATFLITEIWSE